MQRLYGDTFVNFSNHSLRLTFGAHTLLKFSKLQPLVR